MIYGLKALELYDKNISELELFLGGDVLELLNEIAVDKNIYIRAKSSKKVVSKLLLRNADSLSRNNTGSKENNNSHTTSMKFKPVNSNESIPIIVMKDKGENVVHFGSKINKRTKHEEDIYKSKDAKLAERFIKDNFDIIINIGSCETKEDFNKLINSIIEKGEYEFLDKSGKVISNF